MYQVYLIKETSFEAKKLIGEYKDYDDASARIEKELEKDPTIKYSLEETTGHVDSYGELIATVIDSN